MSRAEVLQGKIDGIRERNAGAIEVCESQKAEISALGSGIDGLGARVIAHRLDSVNRTVSNLQEQLRKSESEERRGNMIFNVVLGVAALAVLFGGFYLVNYIEGVREKRVQEYRQIQEKLDREQYEEKQKILDKEERRERHYGPSPGGIVV